jgi:hypothetical protein
VVRKAVASSSVPAAAQEKPRPPAEEEPMPPQARRPLKSSDLKWLHVRVAPKAGGKRGRVSVNVRSASCGCSATTGRSRLGPAAGTTTAATRRWGDPAGARLGQTLVDIEDDEATVKVWVESPAVLPGDSRRPGGDAS